MKRFLSTEFSVGTFALLGLCIIIYMSLKINDRASYAGQTKAYVAKFESVTGLVKRVPVEVSGIKTGYVEKIELIDNTAYVTIHVSKAVRVHQDASLSIRDRGILGDRYISLMPGTSSLPELNDGDEISNTFSKSDLQQLTSMLSKTTKVLEEVMQSDNPKGALGQTIKNLRDLTGKMNTLVGNNEDRIGRILGNIESFTSDLNEITGENKDQIHTLLVALEDVAVSLQDALGTDGNIGEAAARFNKTMERVDKIIAKVERGEGTIGKLLNDETTVDNLNETIEGVKDTLGLFKKVQLGVRYRGEFLMSARELQNVIGLKIAPAPDKYLLFEIVDAPTGQTKRLNTTVSSGGSVISSTETLQTNDEVLFSFLLAKRFWDLTLKFGLIRNEGGVGMDYNLFDDKVILSVEAFDFSRVNNRAHIRAYGTLVLYKHLLITGGVDDLITQSGSKGAFAGAGLQFTDNDLKALLSVLPSSL